jgi:hypothetical protein
MKLVKSEKERGEREQMDRAKGNSGIEALQGPEQCRLAWVFMKELDLNIR